MTPQSTSSSSKKTQKSVQSTDLKSALPNKYLNWNSQGMDVDNVHQETTTIMNIVVE